MLVVGVRDVNARNWLKEWAKDHVTLTQLIRLEEEICKC
jgi:hypothetical protein